MEPGHQAWTLEPVAGVAGAGTVEFGSIGWMVPTARGERWRRRQGIWRFPAQVMITDEED